MNKPLSNGKAMLNVKCTLTLLLLMALSLWSGFSHAQFLRPALANPDSKDVILPPDEWTGKDSIIGPADTVPQGALSLKKTETTAGLRVYPNPSHGFVEVETGTEVQEIFIYNTQGVLVKRWLLSNGPRIDLQDLIPGVYLIADRQRINPPVRIMLVF